MVLRACALLVAVLLLALGGTAAVASAQEPVPADTSEEGAPPEDEGAPWWESGEPDAPDTGTEPDAEPAAGDVLPALDELLDPLEDEIGAGEELLPEIPVPTTKTVAGKVAYVRKDGKAAIPRGAPKKVRQLLAAANQIVGKPKRVPPAGGHAKLVDKGYDCSGAVSYALIRTGLLRAPKTSGGLTRWGSKGDGRWISVYAKKSHVYLEVAGLRLDTSAVSDPGGRKGVRWRPVIGKRPGFKARHPVGL